MRFDDLLVARLAAKQQPDRRRALLELLEQVRAGQGRSLLGSLVSEGFATPDEAKGLEEMATRYKRGRALGVYAQLLVREGVPQGEVDRRMERMAKSQQLSVYRLASDLVAAGLIEQSTSQKVLYQARLAFDRDMARQLREHLNAAPTAPLPNLLDTRRFEARAQLPPVQSALFRLEIPVPGADEADAIVQKELSSEDASRTAPGFEIPDWVDTSDNATGRRLIGDYRIQGRAGVGGMGIVYLAQHLDEPGRPVALKVLKPFALPQTIGRFEREMLANSLFDSEYALDVYAAGKTDAGERYLAVEFFDGRTLFDLLEERGRLAPRRALTLIRQVLLALNAAHGAGIVHRDLKPENVLVSWDETQARLTDFGISLLQRMHEFDELVFHTAGSSALIGTPRYFSPEQATRRPLDHRTDLYSAGLILYEMLSGRSPFDGEGPLAFLACHVAEDPHPLREVAPWTAELPADLHTLIDALLEKERDKRLSDAGEVVRRIDAFLPRVRA